MGNEKPNDFVFKRVVEGVGIADASGRWIFDKYPSTYKQDILKICENCECNIMSHFGGKTKCALYRCKCIGWKLKNV